MNKGKEDIKQSSGKISIKKTINGIEERREKKYVDVPGVLLCCLLNGTFSCTPW